MTDNNAEVSTSNLLPAFPILCDLLAPNYSRNLLDPSATLTRKVKNCMLVLSIFGITDNREAIWYGPWMMVLDIIFMDTQIMPNGVCYPIPQMPVSFNYDPAAESDEDGFSGDSDDNENHNNDPFIDKGRIVEVNYERFSEGLSPSPGRGFLTTLIATPPTTPGGSIWPFPKSSTPSSDSPSPYIPSTPTPHPPPPAHPSPSPGSAAINSSPLPSLTPSPSSSSEPYTPANILPRPTFRRSNTRRHRHHRRSTRVPDICQIVQKIDRDGNGFKPRAGRLIMIVEVKPLLPNGDVESIMHNTESKQVISQAKHAFRSDKNLERLGCIVAVTHFWTYFEYSREDMPPPSTASEDDDSTYDRAASAKTTSSRSGTKSPSPRASSNQPSTRFPAEFLRDIFQTELYLSLHDDQGLSNLAFERIYNHLKPRIDAV